MATEVLCNKNVSNGRLISIIVTSYDDFNCVQSHWRGGFLSSIQHGFTVLPFQMYILLYTQCIECNYTCKFNKIEHWQHHFFF